MLPQNAAQQRNEEAKQRLKLIVAEETQKTTEIVEMPKEYSVVPWNIIYFEDYVS